MKRHNFLFCVLMAGLVISIFQGVSKRRESTARAASASLKTTRFQSFSRRKRGFRLAAPWVSCYGSARNIGDLGKVARSFRIINIDADPGTGNFTRAQITQLKSGGRNRVISYLNLGSMERFRSYWHTVPRGFVSGKDNTAAHLGPYSGYPDETWMNLGNADYQKLILEYVAPRLVAQGVDGFFFDNLELVEHGPHDADGPCDAACRQGGLDLVRRLREKYPTLLFVMQNATGDVTRLGKTGGIPFPMLLDGISHEEVFAPRHDPQAERELQAWRRMRLSPGGRPFWIGTEDYVGSCTHVGAARAVYAASRAQGFSPYVTDASAEQLGICYWHFSALQSRHEKRPYSETRSVGAARYDQSPYEAGTKSVPKKL